MAVLLCIGVKPFHSPDVQHVTLVLRAVIANHVLVDEIEAQQFVGMLCVYINFDMDV